MSMATMLVVSGIGLLAAIASSRLTELTRVPTPMFFLAAAALAANVVPGIWSPSIVHVEQVVTVALILILFDGGMHIGWDHFRATAAPILAVGVIGTLATAGGLAVLAHVIFDIGWRNALLLGTALAPTDPAVVFSVLGQREISGRSGVMLEGESGANDPVGIALIASLLTAGDTSGLHLVGSVAANFALEMAVGAAIGVIGGVSLRYAMQRVPLPNEGLYPLRTLAGAFAIYGLADLSHGSGFLAALVAGIIVGDIHAPYKGDIKRFHAALASLGEVAAFVALGLTIDFPSFADNNGWVLGLVLAVLLTFVVRPLLLAPLLLPVDMRRGEKVLVLWAGLKGAVPILLGTFLLTGDVSDAQELYDAIIVVVAFSVLVQGSLVPTIARRCDVPMRTIEPEPWGLGIRFRERPDNLRRVVVRDGAAAAGVTLADLALPDEVWVTLLVRRGRLVPVTGDTTIEAGDEVVMLVGDVTSDPRAPFLQPAAAGPPG